MMDDGQYSGKVMITLSWFSVQLLLTSGQNISPFANDVVGGWVVMHTVHGAVKIVHTRTGKQVSLTQSAPTQVAYPSQMG